MHFLLDGYKIYKGFDLTDVSNDEKLSLILYGIENYLKEQFSIYLTESEVVETRLVSSDILVVGSHINNIISLIDNKGNNVDVSNVEWFDNIIYLNTVLQGKVLVTYNTGDINLPEALQLAVFIFTDKLFEDVENNANLIERFSDPVAGRQTFKRAFPKEVAKLLASFISYKIG